jgi:LmbE family N-acetylglucosaminyl deacetylase
LLAARKIDKGRQFFTRANDFGFSKSADETLRIWDREKILADVVWTIRQFRPDIIVTRFPLEDDRTHGHHTSSAQLAQEAFKAAADPKRFPEQLKHVETWQPTRLLWNTSTFFFRARNVPFDATGLDPARSRRLPTAPRQIVRRDRCREPHDAQEPGLRREHRARRAEGVFQVPRRQAVENGNLFTGIDTTWARVPKGAELSAEVSAIVAAYDMKKPAASVPALLELRRSLLTSAKISGRRKRLLQWTASLPPASVCISKRWPRNRRATRRHAQRATRGDQSLRRRGEVQVRTVAR